MCGIHVSRAEIVNLKAVRLRALNGAEINKIGSHFFRDSRHLRTCKDICWTCVDYLRIGIGSTSSYDSGQRGALESAPEGLAIKIEERSYQDNLMARVLEFANTRNQCCMQILFALVTTGNNFPCPTVCDGVTPVCRRHAYKHNAGSFA